MDAEELYELEKRICRSKDLILPSDTLRGRVVSEIHKLESGKELASKLARICCIFLICNGCAWMSLRSMQHWWDDHYQPVLSSEILHNADQLRKPNHLEPTESLAEAYGNWKAQLASHWQSSQFIPSKLAD